jgi:hypothetical protein
MPATRISQKDMEINLATQFLCAAEIDHSGVESLSDFVGKYLDNRMPDVVAHVDSTHIGIELTSYTDNRTKDLQGDAIYRIDAIAPAVAMGFGSLTGVRATYRFNENAVLPEGTEVAFVSAVSSFLALEQRAQALVRGMRWYFPLTGSSPIVPNLRTLLDSYLLSLHLDETGIGPKRAFSLRAFSAMNFGTKLVELTRIIDTKAAKKANAYLACLTQLWLLIHATREPTSAAITPLNEHEVELLLNSGAAASARKSGFDKVLLWDYVHGGYVDLVSGQHATCDI